MDVALLITTQKLHAQSDALVPLPRQDAHVSAVERRLKNVLFVNIVVRVTGEDLHRRRRGNVLFIIKFKIILYFENVLIKLNSFNCLTLTVGCD